MNSNRKQTKKEKAIQEITSNYEQTLKDNFIKNIMIGFETASQMYLDKINNGCTIEELKAFIEQCIDKKEEIEKIIVDKND